MSVEHMSVKRVLFIILAVGLSGCLQTIDHTPPDSGQSGVTQDAGCDAGAGDGGDAGCS